MKAAKKKINVVIICGGPSNERDVSLKTGAQILKALPGEKYNSRLIEITKDGRWELKGAVKKELSPANVETKKPTAGSTKSITGYNPSGGILNSFDVAFIGMHGKFGEDGKIQALLEVIGIPYTGSGVLASALGMNKIKTLELAEKYGLTVPNFLPLHSMPEKKEFRLLQNIIAKKIGYSCVVKPNESGSSIGISIVKNKKGLLAALKKAFSEDKIVLAEEYIGGMELTCAVIGNSGQTKLEALPLVEIVPEGKFFDYKSKYFSKKTLEICPARIPARMTAEAQKLAKKIHFALGCDGLTRSDFILTPKNKFYFLEINTIPGLTEASLSPKEAKAAGMSFAEFLDKQLELALLKTRKR